PQPGRHPEQGVLTVRHQPDRPGPQLRLGDQLPRHPARIGGWLGHVQIAEVGLRAVQAGAEPTVTARVLLDVAAQDGVPMAVVGGAVDLLTAGCPADWWRDVHVLGVVARFEVVGNLTTYTRCMASDI